MLASVILPSFIAITASAAAQCHSLSWLALLIQLFEFQHTYAAFEGRPASISLLTDVPQSHQHGYDR